MGTDADFKSYNDRYGHQFGGKALILIAQAVAVRYGGEDWRLPNAFAKRSSR